MRSSMAFLAASIARSRSLPRLRRAGALTVTATRQSAHALSIRRLRLRQRRVGLSSAAPRRRGRGWPRCRAGPGRLELVLVVEARAAVVVRAQPVHAVGLGARGPACRPTPRVARPGLVHRPAHLEVHAAQAQLLLASWSPCSSGPSRDPSTCDGSSPTRRGASGPWARPTPSRAARRCRSRLATLRHDRGTLSGRQLLARPPIRAARARRRRRTRAGARRSSSAARSSRGSRSWPQAPMSGPTRPGSSPEITAADPAARFRRRWHRERHARAADEQRVADSLDRSARGQDVRARRCRATAGRVGRAVPARARKAITSRPSIGRVRWSRQAGSGRTGRRSTSRTRKRNERERGRR